ncbi:polysaccharide deacetylase family protein [Cesiribacter sp. SM1]|uniref:polysaccharide deacetylase family protein n=1 Tax=Cesiribacter sp. SM1 TaxID=2861196 RepID=UPI001CD73CE2|nr:polysaccharide deacetylase family protein [Cesiribacter sp. SM1]
MTAFVVARNSYLLLMLLLAVADYFFLSLSPWVYLALTLLYILLVVAGSSVMSLNFFTRSYTRGRGNTIALTFDDGPSAEHTPAVLEVLDKWGATATFFCIGERMEQNKALVRKIKEKGHRIGNHSYTHSNLFSIFGKNMVVDEIEKTNRLIQELTGEECRLFRPPYGVLNPPIAKAAAACGMQVIGWNIRSFDTTTKDYQKVVERVLPRIGPGAVLLLHDDRENTPKIVDAILAHASRLNLRYIQAQELIHE